MESLWEGEGGVFINCKAGGQQTLVNGGLSLCTFNVNERCRKRFGKGSFHVGSPSIVIAIPIRRLHHALFVNNKILKRSCTVIFANYYTGTNFLTMQLLIHKIIEGTGIKIWLLFDQMKLRTTFCKNIIKGTCLYLNSHMKIAELTEVYHNS